MSIPFDSHQIAVVIVVAALLLGGKKLHETAREFATNFRGPRPPSHPLPGDDAFVLNRKRRAKDGAI